MAEQKKLLEIGFAEYGLTMAFKHVAMKGFPAIWKFKKIMDDARHFKWMVAPIW